MASSAAHERRLMRRASGLIVRGWGLWKGVRGPCEERGALGVMGGGRCEEGRRVDAFSGRN